MKDHAYQAVCNAFGRYFDVHPMRVRTHQHLQRDWGLEPSELSVVAQHIEEIAGVELDDHGELAELHTVGQLVQRVRQRLRRAATDRSARAHEAVPSPSNVE